MDIGDLDIIKVSSEDETVKQLHQIQWDADRANIAYREAAGRKETVLNSLLKVNNDALQFGSVKKHYKELDEELSTIDIRISELGKEKDAALQKLRDYKLKMIDAGYVEIYWRYTDNHIWYSPAKLEEYIKEKNVAEQVKKMSATQVKAKKRWLR